MERQELSCSSCGDKKWNVVPESDLSVPWSLFSHAINGLRLSDKIRGSNSVRRSHLTPEGQKLAFHMLQRRSCVLLFFCCFEYVSTTANDPCISYSSLQSTADYPYPTALNSERKCHKLDRKQCCQEVHF